MLEWVWRVISLDETTEWGSVEGGTTSVAVSLWIVPSVKTQMRPGKS